MPPLLKFLNWKLFGSFLLLGLSSGLFLGSLQATWASASEGVQKQQVNYLFAVVSDEQGEVATLQALWLAATRPESGEINWMPLYPQPLSDADARRGFSSAHEAIRLSGGVDGLIGLPLLRELGINWDEAFILDNDAFERIGVLLNVETQGDLSIQTAIQPQLALQEQVRFVQAFCQAGSQLAVPGILDTILALYPEHLRSSLNQFEVIALWDQLAERDFSVSCHHPWADN